MGIKYNGTDITAVKYNGTTIDKVIYNGTTVFQRVTAKTYRYNFAGLLCGNSSGISGSAPSGTGEFTVGTTNGAMWCLSTTGTDSTGYGVTFSDCLTKTITSIKMYVYRNNTQTFNTESAVYSGWIYNPAPTTSGAKNLVKNSTELNNAGITHIDTTTPVPTTTGLVQISLTTAQLKTCFTMTPTTINAAAGHSPSQIPAGTYVTLGLRGLYSNNPRFVCVSNNATYGYVEIVTQE